MDYGFYHAIAGWESIVKSRFVLPVLIAGLFGLCSEVHGQANFSVYAGANIASLVGDDAMRGDLPPRNKVRLGAGVGWITHLGGPFGFRLDLVYVEKGAKYSGIGEPVDFELAYIELPAMLEMYFYTRNEMTPKFYFGTSFGVNLSARTEEGGVSVNLKDSMERTELGFIIGVGVDCFERFEVSMRYTIGLMTVHRNQNIDERTRSVLIIAGLLL